MKRLTYKKAGRWHVVKDGKPKRMPPWRLDQQSFRMWDRLLVGSVRKADHW